MKLEEIRNGGDLDVVAFVETVRVWAECKAVPQQELPHQRRRFRGLYWAPRNVYVANVQGKIGDTLDAVLRLYDSQIRHYVFFGGPVDYAMEFVAGTVTKIEQAD